MSALQFEALGADRVTVPLAVMYVDHNVLQIDDKNMDEHRYLQSFSARYGIRYSRPGNGISHYVHLERFAKPGELLVRADSHSTMAGAVGMFAAGAGGLDVAVAMAGYGFSLEYPKIVGVGCTESYLPGCSRKTSSSNSCDDTGCAEVWDGSSSSPEMGFDPLCNGSGHDMQYDHGAGRHRRRLPERRANSRMVRHPEDARTTSRSQPTPVPLTTRTSP